MGYKLVLGPFLECHVRKLAREKSFNYAKRLGVGIKTHIALELPTFVLMLFWYWIMLILALIFWDVSIIYLSLGFMGVRIIHGLLMRLISKNRIMLSDIVMGLFFDLFGTFYLLYSFNNSYVTWRGIKYEVKKGGFIEETIPEEEAIEEER
jgi:hypothetical protein